jgi:hypothetical protein
MKTVERLAASSAKALSLGLRRGVKQAIRGQQKGTAVRGGARIAFDINGDIVAQFDKDGKFTGNLDLKLLGPVFAQLPGVNLDAGAGGTAASGWTRSENLDGTEKVRMEVWCEYANALAIEEDEDNFGDADADLDTWDANDPAQAEPPDSE